MYIVRERKPMNTVQKLPASLNCSDHKSHPLAMNPMRRYRRHPDSKSSPMPNPPRPVFSFRRISKRADYERVFKWTDDNVINVTDDIAAIRSRALQRKTQ